MVEHLIESLQYAGPELVLTGGLLLAIVLELVFPRRHDLMAGFTVLTLVATGYVLLRTSDGSAASVFSNMMAVDPFAVFFKGIILLTTIIIVLFSMISKELREGTRYMGEYYALLIAMTLGMFLMSSASNLLMIYLAIELTSISSYILSGFIKEARDSSEASLKYVIYGAVASGMMLYGISILYGLTDAVDIYAVNEALATGHVSVLPLFIAGVLIVVGMGFKITAVPFHFWSPDVYEGAPLTITAILAVASKAAGFAVMLRFFMIAMVDPAVGGFAAGYWATFGGFEWNMIIAVLSVLTMTLGNLVAVWQNNMKRLLAYSSIAHAGYMLMGVAVLSGEGLAAVLIYFIVYLFMNLGAFYVVMLVANKTGSEDIDTYKGLGYRSPMVAVCMAIFLVALTGIPPTAGFIGKLYIFAALISAEWFWLAVVGIVNTVISLYYYVRVFRNMFLRDPEASAEPIGFSPAQLVLLLALAIPTILFGLYFTPLVEIAQASVIMFTGR